MSVQVKCVSEDRLVAFDDGSSVYADVILYCTGYAYNIFYNMIGVFWSYFKKKIELERCFKRKKIIIL